MPSNSIRYFKKFFLSIILLTHVHFVLHQQVKLLYLQYDVNSPDILLSIIDIELLVGLRETIALWDKLNYDPSTKIYNKIDKKTRKITNKRQKTHAT